MTHSGLLIIYHRGAYVFLGFVEINTQETSRQPAGRRGKVASGERL